jgi:hypothetical protein
MKVGDGGMGLLDVQRYLLTYPRVSFLPYDKGAFDNGSARIVYAVQHGL